MYGRVTGSVREGNRKCTGGLPTCTGGLLEHTRGLPEVTGGLPEHTGGLLGLILLDYSNSRAGAIFLN